MHTIRLIHVKPHRVLSDQCKLVMIQYLTVCRLHEQDIAPHYLVQVKKALNQYFSSTSFMKQKQQNGSKENTVAPGSLDGDPDPTPLKSFFIPSRFNTDSPGTQYEGYHSSLWKLRDQVSFTPLFVRGGKICGLGNMSKGVLVETSHIWYGSKQGLGWLTAIEKKRQT